MIQRILLCFALASLFAVTTPAQGTGQGAEREQRFERRAEQRQRIEKRADRNEDGQLGPREKKALRERARRRGAKRHEQGPDRRELRRDRDARGRAEERRPVKRRR
jgi:hypothetical protein